MFADIVHIVEVILVVALALIALFVVLLIVVAMMPRSNPLKIILAALANRVGLTAGLMLFDPVATAVPVAGEAWDLITIIGLIYFWYTFFKQLPGMRAAWEKSAEHFSRYPPSGERSTRNQLGKRTAPGPGWKAGLPPRF